MSGSEPIPLEPRIAARSSPPTPEAVPQAAVPAQVSFDRRELQDLLTLYGKMVAAGECRDYAIDFLRDQAVFSVFRRASEAPIYRIEKTPRLARRQGAYAVVAAGGLVLKRGPDLARVLAVLEKKTLRLVAG